MIEIAGKITEPRCAEKRCPHDGVHRAKADGTIRHPRMGYLDGRPLFFGNEAFYFHTGDDIGYKVYHALRLGVGWGRDKIEYIARQMALFHPFAATAFDIDEIALDVCFRGKQIRKTAYALAVQHVYYPEKAWIRFCRGYPYDWNVVAHPEHSPDGFRRFVASAARVVPRLHKKSLVLGGTAWCSRQNRWIIMDVDWRGPEHGN